MKIIGTQNSDGCIALLSKDEFAQIAGFCSSYNMEQQTKRNMETGIILTVSTIYNDAKFLLELYANLRKDIEANQKRLERLASMLTPPKGEEKPKS